MFNAHIFQQPSERERENWNGVVLELNGVNGCISAYP